MSDGCDGRYAEGFFVRESEDLLHWSDRKQCFSPADGWGENSYWAPEVVYHKIKFIMHYSCRSRSLHSLRIGVAVSDSSFGPFQDVHGGPMFDLGYATIDASVLISRKGNYLYYSRDCGENKINGIWTSQLYCVRLNEELTQKNIDEWHEHGGTGILYKDAEQVKTELEKLTG